MRSLLPVLVFASALAPIAGFGADAAPAGWVTMKEVCLQGGTSQGNADSCKLMVQALSAASNDQAVLVASCRPWQPSDTYCGGVQGIIDDAPSIIQIKALFVGK